MLHARARKVRSPPVAEEGWRNQFLETERRAAAPVRAPAARDNPCRCRFLPKSAEWSVRSLLFEPVRRGEATRGPRKSTAIAPRPSGNCFTREMFGIFSRAAHRAVVAQAFRRIRDFQFRRGSPQPLQIVITPRLFAENVHHETSKIQPRPLGRALSLAMPRRTLGHFIQLLFDFAANGLHLRRAESGADHEVFRERPNAAEVQHGNPAGLFF